MLENTLEFLKDLWGFLNKRKKFWLAPLIITLGFTRGFDCLYTRIGDRPFYLYSVLSQSDHGDFRRAVVSAREIRPQTTIDIESVFAQMMQSLVPLPVFHQTATFAKERDSLWGQCLGASCLSLSQQLWSWAPVLAR